MKISMQTIFKLILKQVTQTTEQLLKGKQYL